MRVIAGTARSMPLVCPKGDGTRPTTDRIKETLFNMLQNDVPGAVFVDAFAGSGAIGIEALSRGAKKAYFIENAKEPLECIGKNLQFTKMTDRSVVLKNDVLSALNHIFEKEIDIFFLDPPYGKGLDRQVLEALSGYRFITENTLIIIEEEVHADFSYAEEIGYEIVKEKIYKTNKHVFLRKAEA